MMAGRSVAAAIVVVSIVSDAYDLTVRHDDWLAQAQAVTLEKGLRIEN